MSLYKSISIFLLFMLAFFASILLKPDFSGSVVNKIPDFKTIIPVSLSNWTMVQNHYQPISLSVEGEKNIDQPYDSVLMETFQNNISEQTIMLAIAYGANQQQEIKIHRPELCYPAQGFEVKELSDLAYEVKLNSGAYHFKLTKLLSQSKQRKELTLYWIRIGDIISSNPWEIRWNILKGGLSKNIPDGILVRTSQVLLEDMSVEESIKTQKEFITGLLKGIENKDKSIITLFIPEGKKE